MADNKRTTRSRNETPVQGKPRSGKGVIERNRTLCAIALCVAAAAVLIGLIVGAVFLFTDQGGDNTMNANVYIAGINTYGMTKEDAISAVRLTAQNSYPNKPLVVSVGGARLELDPAITGASLDIEAAVTAAFASSYVTNRHYIFDLTPYLNLNTQAIMDKLDELTLEFGTPLTQTTYTVLGEQPDLSVAESNEPNQILQIVVGTPEYQLDMQLLYQQVMDAYNQALFQIEAECPKIEPDPLDLLALYTEYLVPPVNATMDPETYKTTPETYGYAFDLDLAQTMLEDAAYGEVLEIPFARVVPSVTLEGMQNGMYHDVLGTYTATAASDKDRDVNLKLACEAINGTILYPGEVFSFNNVVGERTEKKGYKPGPSYLGYETVYTIGGGICQVSSALYYSVLLADLQIVERESHTFAPDYIPLGTDAVLNWKTLDFRFRNNSTTPIRIDAKATGGTVTVTIMGVDTKDYYVLLESEVLKTIHPTTIYQVMNPGSGYSDGQVLSTPYTGYEVNIYRCKYSKDDNTLIARELESTSKYASRNEIICKIEEKPEPPPVTDPDPTDPTPTDPTGPDGTVSSTTEPTTSGTTGQDPTPGPTQASSP